MAVRNWNKSSAFAHFGARCANDRWGWSGANADGSIIVLTLWTDLICADRPGYSYSDFDLPSKAWQTTAGNTARKRHIAHALDKLDGRFRAIYARPVDPEADPRTIKSCEPKDMWWRIDRFDSGSGEFSATMLDS